MSITEEHNKLEVLGDIKKITLIVYYKVDVNGSAKSYLNFAILSIINQQTKQYCSCAIKTKEIFLEIFWIKILNIQSRSVTKCNYSRVIFLQVYIS